MDGVVFSMQGDPRGKGRPRTRVVAPKAGPKWKKPFATVFTDDKTREYETSVAKLARDAMGDMPPLQGPLSVSLRFRIKPPKSMGKGQRARVLAGEEPYLGAYDIDNLAKSILDGCNAVCFADDKQIVRLFATKVADEHAGVDVKIVPLAPQGEW